MFNQLLQKIPSRKDNILWGIVQFAVTDCQLFVYECIRCVFDNLLLFTKY